MHVLLNIHVSFIAMILIIKNIYFLNIGFRKSLLSVLACLDGKKILWLCCNIKRFYIS
jgi:hypothetical protein